MSDHHAATLRALDDRLRRVRLAKLPTPIVSGRLDGAWGSSQVAVKRDDLSSEQYGGNKVRKLEYLLQRALDKGARRIATFGTVGSNHALATSLYADSLGIPCTCLIMHQRKTPGCARALGMHAQLGTELIRFGGNRSERVSTMRRHLQGRGIWVIPAGGSNWLGAVGFVRAALELAAQVSAGETPLPHRLYVASGTMGTAAGLCLGLAIAGLPTEVHAVRVTHEFVANPAAMHRLIQKTVAMLHGLGIRLPAGLADGVRLRFRDEFFAGGYAHTDKATESAIASARRAFGISLESTYTGKAMAALLHDLGNSNLAGKHLLFWHTYNSRPLPLTAAAGTADIPEEFRRYL
jgi:D-cysteine desulfhydrase